MPLSAKGQPGLQPFPPSAGQRGRISAHSHSTTGVEVESVLSPVLLPQIWHVRPFLLRHLHLGVFGRDARFPGLLPISVPSLDTEGPLMLPRLPVPRALATLPGWSE